MQLAWQGVLNCTFLLKRLHSRDMASFTYYDNVYILMVFVTTQASLLVKEATEISVLLEIRVNERRRPFSEAPSFF